MGHGQESVDDDGASSTAESNREKGRGSYKCGRVSTFYSDIAELFIRYLTKMFASL
jgi:hypothetical protein